MAQTKNCEHCGTSLEGKKANAKYCNSTCRSRATTERKINNAVQMKTSTMQGIPTPNQGMASGMEFMYQKEINKLEGQVTEYKGEVKELHKKLETKNETIKNMELDIVKAQYEKQEEDGLNGLPEKIEQMAPLMPLLEGLMERFAPKGGGQIGGLPPMDIPTQQRVIDVAITLNELPDEQQAKLINILAAVYQGNREQAIELINQTSFNNGTTKAINS